MGWYWDIVLELVIVYQPIVRGDVNPVLVSFLLWAGSRKDIDPVIHPE